MLGSNVRSIDFLKAIEGIPILVRRVSSSKLRPRRLLTKSGCVTLMMADVGASWIFRLKKW